MRLEWFTGLQLVQQWLSTNGIQESVVVQSIGLDVSSGLQYMLMPGNE